MGFLCDVARDREFAPPAATRSDRATRVASPTRTQTAPATPTPSITPAVSPTDTAPPTLTPTRTGTPVLTPGICGDGLRQANEECDDDEEKTSMDHFPIRGEGVRPS